MPVSKTDLAEAGISLVLSNEAGASLAMSDVGNLAAISSGQKTNYRKNFFHALSYAFIVATATTAVLALIAASSSIAYLAMSLGLLLSVAAAGQRFSLSRQETFRQVHNRIREQANRLQQENNVLVGENSRLAAQAARVRRTEHELQSVLQSQHQSVDTFVSLVKQNRAVLDEIQQNLLMEIVQSFLSALLRSDVDGDFYVDPEEVDILLARVKALPGVQYIDEDRVRHLLLSRGHGIENVYNLVHDLTEEEKRWVTVSAQGVKV